MPTINQLVRKPRKAEPVRNKVPALRGLPAAPRRLHAGLYHHAEEAQFGVAQGRPRALDQWLRGHQLHPRRGAQPSGALRGPDPWWTGQGPARRALSRDPRHARYPGRVRKAPAPFEIRRETTKVGSAAMARRRAAEKRDVLPDPKYGDAVLSRFMNAIMLDGKKSVAERIVYGAFDKIESRDLARAAGAVPRGARQRQAAARGALARGSVARPTRCRWRFARAVARPWRSAGSSTSRASAPSGPWSTGSPRS